MFEFVHPRTYLSIDHKPSNRVTHEGVCDCEQTCEQYLDFFIDVIVLKAFIQLKLKLHYRAFS